MGDVLADTSSSLVAITRLEGETTAKAIVVLLLKDLVDFFNVGKIMSPNQMAQTAELIVEDELFKFYKPSDLNLCFKKAKRGEFGNGKVYDRIDGALILDWLKDYAKQRDEEIIHLRTIESKKAKKSSSNLMGFFEKFEGVTEAEKIESIEKLKQVLSEKTNTVTEAKEPRFVHSTFDQLIQRWMIAFDGLHFKNGFNQSGTRFIRKYKMVLTQESYLKFKSAQFNRVKARIK